MAADDTKRKRKGPSPNIGLQQRVPVKQLVYTPKCVTLTLLVFGAICVIIGIICTMIEATVTTYPASGPYIYFEKTRTPAYLQTTGWSLEKVQSCGANDNCGCPCTKYDNCEGQGPGEVKACLVQFELKEDMPGPIYFYYTLNNFYQNNQRVVRSHSAEMVRGDEETIMAAVESGSGFPACDPYESYKVGERKIYYYPCGLLSRSLFNDTFTLRKQGEEPVAWVSKDIAPSSSGGSKGRNVAMTQEWHRKHCYRFPGADREALEAAGYDEGMLGFTGSETGTFDCWHNISDEAYQVRYFCFSSGSSP